MHAFKNSTGTTIVDDDNLPDSCGVFSAAAAASASAFAADNDEDEDAAPSADSNTVAAIKDKHSLMVKGRHARWRMATIEKK